ncbi:hypothetical protein GEMRC1_002157 [Eukaryota sp. GEM-RC1]
MTDTQTSSSKSVRLGTNVTQEGKRLKRFDQRIRTCTQNIANLQKAQERYLNTLLLVLEVASQLHSLHLPSSPTISLEVSDYIDRLLPDGTLQPYGKAGSRPILIKELSDNLTSHLSDLKEQHLRDFIRSNVSSVLLTKSKIHSFLSIRTHNHNQETGPYKWINTHVFSDLSPVPPNASLPEVQQAKVFQTRDYSQFVLDSVTRVSEASAKHRKEQISTGKMSGRVFTVFEAVKIIEQAWVKYKEVKPRKQTIVDEIDLDDDEPFSFADDCDYEQLLSKADLEAYLDRFPLKPSFNDVIHCYADFFPSVFHITISQKSLLTPLASGTKKPNQRNASKRSLTQGRRGKSTPYWQSPDKISTLVGPSNVDQDVHWLLDVINTRSRKSLLDDLQV